MSYVTIHEISTSLKKTLDGRPNTNDISTVDLTRRLYIFADNVCLFYPDKYDFSLEANMERNITLIFEFARLNNLLLSADKIKL